MVTHPLHFHQGLHSTGSGELQEAQGTLNRAGLSAAPQDHVILRCLPLGGDDLLTQPWRSGGREYEYRAQRLSGFTVHRQAAAPECRDTGVHLMAVLCGGRGERF
ncbi:hypothetical protein E2C01_091505 [Portunus trituberculatus]|uniref:Uncharacterized protein n=1 Tax=Portunus trituberculatus TaxID=210409 RepID=A0A5B7JT20_PORTR|nr:hypothetical protein [Portunus trituberculatus]